jgi:hypothetical protein
MKLMSFPLVFHPGGQESSVKFRIAALRGFEIEGNGEMACNLRGAVENDHESGIIEIAVQYGGKS